MPDENGQGGVPQVNKRSTLAKLEKRLRGLEKTTDYTDVQSPSCIRATIEKPDQHFEHALEKRDQQINALGEEYNALEERIYVLECAKDNKPGPDYSTQGRRLEAVEERIRLLECARNHGPENADRAQGLRIEAVEERIHSLECAKNDKPGADDETQGQLLEARTANNTQDQRLDALEALIKPYEEYAANALDAVKQLNDLKASPPWQKLKEDTPPPQPAFASQESFEALVQRMQKLEQCPSPPPSLIAPPVASIVPSSQSTHELARALLHRLSSGDLLDSTIALQLHTALNLTSAPSRGLKRSSPTPALTDPSTKRTSLNSTTDEEPPRKRPRGRPPRTSLSSQGSNSTPDDERPRKRMGRPPTHGRYVGRIVNGRVNKNWKLGSNSSNAGSAKAETEIIQPTVEDTVDSASTPAPSLPQKATSPQPSTPLAKIPAITTGENNQGDDFDQSDNLDQVDDFSGNGPDEQEENVEIPPERRSGRTPKQAKQFGELLSWKEANLVLQSHES